MTIASGPPIEDPPATLRFRRSVNPLTSLKELWHSRELVYTLARRALLVRYKQAFLGAAWALLTPLTLMVVFSLIFNRAVRTDTGGVPYAVFSYLGLVPWTFFSTALSHGTPSLVTNKAILNKVYFPREVFPISSIVVAAVDLAAASIGLVALFLIHGVTPRVTSLWLPVPFLIQIAFSLGLALLLAAVTVYVRDLQHALPLILQVGLFATPVAYGFDVIPSGWRLLYSFLNPLGPVIDTYRRTVFYGAAPNWGHLAPAAASSVALLIVGYLVFKRLEPGIADVA